MTDPIPPSRAEQIAAERAVMDAAEALAKAEARYAPMRGPHEGYAVILEELDELWAEVKRWPKHDPADMRKEALHVAAMALRFIKDVCDAHE
jgi:phage terminase large subunit GpA-like protein